MSSVFGNLYNRLKLTNVLNTSFTAMQSPSLESFYRPLRVRIIRAGGGGAGVVFQYNRILAEYSADDSGRCLSLVNIAHCSL